MAKRDISFVTIARKLRKAIKPYHHLKVCLLKDKDNQIGAIEVRAKYKDQFYNSIYWRQITAILDVIKDSNSIAFIHAEKDTPIIHIHKL